MRRAAVIIGVNRAGNLPVLNDAVAGAQELADWARSQSPKPKVVLHTDSTRAVTVAAIQKSIARLVAARNLDQLLVYFAGHGVNIGYSELWLLSEAPTNTSAAVNVDQSIVLARRCGIPHVVLFSDACRTAAESIQAQLVTGSGIFPNDPVPGPEQAVDVFFATALGKPALEVKDVQDAAGAFRAVFTRCLVDALEGERSEVVEAQRVGAKSVGLVRPWPLKRFLIDDVPRRLAQLQPGLTITQVPDARITSAPDAWISQFELPQAGPVGPALPQPPGSGQTSPGTPTLVAPMPPLTLHGMSDALIGAAMGGRLPDAQTAAADPAAELVAAARTGARAFGRRHFETQCGIKIRGARLGEFRAGAAGIGLAGSSTLRVDLGAASAASVLVGLRGGSAVLVPAVQGLLTALTFNSGELVDISYEPSDNTSRWVSFQARAAATRKLRGAVSAAAQFGTLQLDAPQSGGLADRMAELAVLDPALAAIAAFAFHDSGQRLRVVTLNEEIGVELGVSVFDVALLAGSLSPESSAGLPTAPNDDIGTADDDTDTSGFEGSRLVPSIAPVYPGLPMLVRSWGLLGAYQVALPDDLAQLRAHLLPGMWAQYDRDGSALIAAALSTGRIR